MDTTKKTNFSLKSPNSFNLIFFLLSIFFITIYCATHYLDKINLFSMLIIGSAGVKIISLAFKEIGFAFLVSAIINISIESFNRSRHELQKKELIDQINLAHEKQRTEQIKAINEQIFRTVYERDLPPYFFREIEGQLLKCEFLRTDSRYDITILRHSDEYARLIVRHRYFITNISARDSEHTVTFSFDALKKLENFHFFHLIKIGDMKKAGQEIEIKRENKSDMHEWWEASITRTIKPGEAVECEIEYERISALRGKEAICTMLPTSSMVVRVNDPSKFFHIRGMSLHPRTERNNSSGPDDGTYEWHLDGVLFPGQGFLMDWVPRD